MTAPCWMCNGTKKVARKRSPVAGDKDARKRETYAYGDPASPAFVNAPVVDCPECAA